MAIFDISLGIHERTLQRVLDRIHKQLYPNYFTGRNTFEKAGAKFNVMWDVKNVPRIDLTPVAPPAAALADVIGMEETPEPGLEAMTTAVSSRTFRVFFSNVGLFIDGAGTQAKTTADAVAYVNVSTGSNYRIEFKVLRAEATTPRADDKWVLDKAIIPQAVKLAQSLIDAIVLPDLRFPGGDVMWPMPILYNGYLVILANDPSNHFEVGLDMELPATGDAFLTVRNTVIGSAFLRETYNRRESYLREGSRDLGITTARWDTRISVERMKLEGQAGLEFRISADVGGSARGWLTSVFGDIGVNFSCQAVPRVTGNVRARIDDARNTFMGQVLDVSTFVIALTPDGSVIERVMGYVVSPLTLIMMALSPLITLFIKGISFDVWSIPEIPVSFDKVHFTIRLARLQLAQRGPIVSLTGGVELV